MRIRRLLILAASALIKQAVDEAIPKARMKVVPWACIEHTAYALVEG